MVSDVYVDGVAADALASCPRETCTHLALSALFALQGKAEAPLDLTVARLRQEVQRIVGDGVTLPDALDDAIGEM